MDGTQGSYAQGSYAQGSYAQGSYAQGSYAQGTDKDDDMLVFPAASLCRGRLARVDSLSHESFTTQQLDDIAPLSRRDLLSLRLNNPSTHAKRILEQRIKAAGNLKYRTTDAK